MSGPDPKVWAPEPWEVSEVAMQSDSEFGDNDESGIVALCESVARRRALAELRALAVSLDEDERGTHDTQDGLTEAWREVCARIAEIEAEETSQPSASAQTATP